MQQTPFDLVVYGATSFVGRLLTRYLLTTFGGDGTQLNWAIAGRSHERLKALCAELGPEAMQLPLITANAKDEAALGKLCEQTRSVVSTVGPYALLGEPLVKVCAHSGTDYCDLSGEVPWMRRMIKTYEPVAQASGARMVHCCGFDSIPSDLGVYYLQRHMQARFEQPAERVRMLVRGIRGGLSGGTVASLMQVAREAAGSQAVRRELADPYSLCPDVYPHTVRQPHIEGVTWDPETNAWLTPFLGAMVNTRIVLRSNALFNAAYGTAFQYDEAIRYRSRAKARAAVMGERGFLALTSRPMTRRLLERFVVPKPGQGPDAKKRENGYFKLEFSGRSAAGDRLQVTVTGDQDPGYGSTARMLGQAATCLAFLDRSELAGGFWTPASAMGDRLLERLMRFSVLSFEVTPAPDRSGIDMGESG